LLQKHLTCGTELILIGWKIVPNEEHVQCDHRFAAQPLANEPLRSSQLFERPFCMGKGEDLDEEFFAVTDGIFLTQQKPSLLICWDLSKPREPL
jgi:hypothetical protein